jgi:hypothetical protein
LDEFGRHPFHALVYAFWLLLGCAFASMAFFEVLAYSELYIARLLGVSKFKLSEEILCVQHACISFT